VEETVYFFFRLVCLCCYVFFRSRIQYLFHMHMARYSKFVLKVPLNTNKPNQSLLHYNICSCTLYSANQLLAEQQFFINYGIIFYLFCLQLSGTDYLFMQDFSLLLAHEGTIV